MVVGGRIASKCFPELWQNTTVDSHSARNVGSNSGTWATKSGSGVPMKSTTLKFDQTTDIRPKQVEKAYRNLSAGTPIREISSTHFLYNTEFVSIVIIIPGRASSIRAVKCTKGFMCPGETHQSRRLHSQDKMTDPKNYRYAEPHVYSPLYAWVEVTPWAYGSCGYIPSTSQHSAVGHDVMHAFPNCDIYCAPEELPSSVP
jgi:hypothetical protein